MMENMKKSKLGVFFCRATSWMLGVEDEATVKAKRAQFNALMARSGPADDLKKSLDKILAESVLKTGRMP